ncbi:dual specificity protein phosphatase PHS1 isoform X2, partial [Tanacetum coccineum]
AIASAISRSLMFVMVCTRPDITHAVGVVSRYMAKPGREHWEAVKRILRYIKGTSDVALCFGDSDLIVTGYVDSDYAGDLDGSKSTTGHVFTLSGGTVSWVLKLQSVVAMSTTEAEYVAAAQASKEAVWLKMLLEELGHAQEKITIFCDNQSALYLARNPTFHSKTKHIRVQYHFVSEKVEEGTVDMRKIHTDDNVADYLTKAINCDKFIWCRSSCGLAETKDFDREDLMELESQSHFAPCVSPQGKESDSNDTELQKTAPKASSSGCKENLDPFSPMSRDSSHGKSHKGSATTHMTSRLRGFRKYAKVDAELNKELEQWNKLLKTEANFNSGFFKGNESNAVVDAHELKLRLEHILERISLISDAGKTEKPSSVTSFLFIGGALAARSVYTLQHIGITHILCLCSNEIGQSDSQRQDLFEYQNFSICDEEDSNISEIFEETHQFIDAVEQKGGKVLVHCFEGRSRSATVVLAYLMTRKNYTLQKAWNTLRRVHKRAQPNDGFATVLLELDRKLHGNVSMEWQQKKPSEKVCQVCGKTAGLSSSSLKLHLRKAHKKLSSGSVDSAMTMEMQKVLEARNIAPRQSHTMD